MIEIKIGDVIERIKQPQVKYPSSWFGQDEQGNKLRDERSPAISPTSATVFKIGASGYWARGKNNELYHVSRYSINEGRWIRKA